ncbi:GNAT family N-acetyltransferase [Kitasatospora sp. LaBMicrA B282]|uniref:GNAT family N-acetyltransferase n=1 Tax=Kitasatospora sp. LaBMicrA B282 TaxID=3420949 RepID=UPI003D104A33
MDLPPNAIELGELTLRRFDPEADFAEFFATIEESLEHLRPFMPWVADHSAAATREFLAGRPERWAAGEEFSYAILLDGAIVGACGLMRRADAPADGREIGYWLHPAATGRGLATRAARALVEAAFRLPGVAYVEVAHDVDNHASGAVPARLGFRRHRRRPVEPLAPAETGEDQVWRLTRHQAESPAG